MFKVNEISKLLGVDRSFLHYYDEVGIIVPEKNEKLYRSYNENDLIALASSKYYRAMNMPLKTLSEMILTSNFDEKISIMQAQKEELLYQAELCKDLALMSEAAMDTYRLAYHDEIVEREIDHMYEYIPIVHQGKFDKVLIQTKEIKELLNFFPFVSYAYYFPKGSLIHQENFDYSLGIAVIPAYRQKYGLSLPETYLEHKGGKMVLFSITKDMGHDGLTYEEFEKIRKYSEEHHLDLTGEAIAYCVFSNYEKEHAQIKLVVYCLTK